MNDAIWLGFKFGLVGAVLQLGWHIYSHSWGWEHAKNPTEILVYIVGSLIFGTILPFILGCLIGLLLLGFRRLRRISN